MPRARRSRLGRVLPTSFYDRSTELVARELLGAVIESHSPEGVASGRIVETEAYVGEHDPACHAAAGLTRRTAPIYGPPGMSYVYLIYGMHWCLNAVTHPAGQPGAVLVRALEPLAGTELMWSRRPHARKLRDLANGPGKLCAALAIGGAQNDVPLQGPALVIRGGTPVEDYEVEVTPRIGIVKAADWPLRYIIRESPFISRTPKGFPRLPYVRPR